MPDSRINRLISNLKLRNIDAFFLESFYEVNEKLLQMIPTHCTVGIGHSITVQNSGIVEKLEDLISRERNLFVVDTLEYLYKGGRIGGAKMLFGSLLQVKPLLNLKNGQVEPVESQRTSKKALSRLKEIVVAECKEKGCSMFSIQHGAARDAAETLANEFKQLLNLDQVEIYDLPPAFLTHSGPGVLGVSYFVDKN